ncbi:hypothetical protein [Pararhizobium sp.]|uniref:hypothetical protein n=1 Tax=Pararhizobium sp. TaxID=1977563 RepID=UPI00271D68D2|nr:hypothetical protein [Pararhizobium sp.]MDO9416397.1 hypothetical protein [Pararhizobium sp.]
MSGEPGSGLEAALERFMDERNLSREAATIEILRLWLSVHGYFGGPDEDATPLGGLDPEQVQYPGYFKGKGSL